MAIIDEFKSEKNRNLIVQASTKMLLEKYNITLNADVLLGIIHAIITTMSKDAVLMNNTVKLMELNTITLTKMKDYITKNMNPVNSPEESDLVANVPQSEPEHIYNRGDILTNEELLLRVKEYEHNRVITNTILTTVDAAGTAGTPDSAPVSANNSITSTSVIPNVTEIMEKVITSMKSTNTFVNKKTLIINSYSRDWINYLSLSILTCKATLSHH